jgi:hypothetical protein
MTVKVKYLIIFSNTEFMRQGLKNPLTKRGCHHAASKDYNKFHLSDLYMATWVCKKQAIVCSLVQGDDSIHTGLIIHMHHTHNSSAGEMVSR